MAHTTYAAVFEQANDGSWSGYAPDLPVIASGETREEAEAQMREAIALYIDEMKASGFPIPPPTAHVINIEVAA